MNQSTASTATLTFTLAAINAATDAGLTATELSRAAERAISNEWIECCDTWAECRFDMFVTLPGARYAGRFVSFLARFGGPENTQTTGPIVVMTLVEAQGD